MMSSNPYSAPAEPVTDSTPQVPLLVRLCAWCGAFVALAYGLTVLGALGFRLLRNPLDIIDMFRDGPLVGCLILLSGIFTLLAAWRIFYLSRV